MEIVSDGPTLFLSGDFDVRSTWEVRTAIYDHLEETEGDAVLDVSRVDSVDVTALKVLAVATRRAHAQGHRMLLRGCSPAVRRLSHLSRLYPQLELEGSPLSA